MNHDKISISGLLLTGLALVVLTRSVAVSKAASGTSKQTEGKRADEKKAAPKKIDVHVKVFASDGKRLPANSVVEISGKESGCGSLSSNDATATIDDNGEATFHEVPVCRVKVKMRVNMYLPATMEVDLADYKSPILLTLEPEH